MTVEGAWTRTYTKARDGVVTFHDWQRETSLAVQMLLIVSWALVMGALAQLAIPKYPVPYTMQTFGVLLGAVLLGTRGGVMAQGVYVGAGVAGVPWFQGFAGGWGVFTATTLGYLVAFPLAAWFVGTAVNHLRIRSYFGLVGVMAIGAAIILLMGWVWLAFGFGPAVGMGPHEAFMLGVGPFLAADIAKVFLAAAIAIPFLPPARR